MEVRYLCFLNTMTISKWDGNQFPPNRRQHHRTSYKQQQCCSLIISHKGDARNPKSTCRHQMSTTHIYVPTHPHTPTHMYTLWQLVHENLHSLRRVRKADWDRCELVTNKMRSKKKKKTLSTVPNWLFGSCCNGTAARLDFQIWSISLNCTGPHCALHYHIQNLNVL